LLRRRRVGPWRPGAEEREFFYPLCTNCLGPCRERTRRRWWAATPRRCSTSIEESRAITVAEIEDAGQQEFLNWVRVDGAMHELPQKVEILDYLETYIFNSGKCLAMDRPQMSEGGGDYEKGLQDD
jgi:hypothetical protein